MNASAVIKIRSFCGCVRATVPAQWLVVESGNVGARGRPAGRTVRRRGQTKEARWLVKGGKGHAYAGRDPRAKVHAVLSVESSHGRNLRCRLSLTGAGPTTLGL
jgi:hypothetical protein